jgi:hypothetical protein
VQKAKGERGVPLTTNVPYGYVKDPADPKHWVIDPEAAALGKRIFNPCVWKAAGHMQIAKQLKADKVLTPAAYKKRQGAVSTPTMSRKIPLTGTATVVRFGTAGIHGLYGQLQDLHQLHLGQEAAGESFGKAGCVLATPIERIIDDDVFDKVQEIRRQRHRRTKTGKSSLFSGLVYCADCGAKMRYCTTSYFEKRQDHFVCSSYRSNTGTCSAHFIRAVILEEYGLETHENASSPM